MITKDEIYPGARVVYDDPEHPQENPIRGTVTSTELLSNGQGPLDYIIYMLPDAEFAEQIIQEDNHLYGLQMLPAFHASLLPKEKEKITDTPHEMVRFSMQIDLNDNAKGNNQAERIKSFYTDIISMLSLYGFSIQHDADYTAPEAKKGKQRVYCHHRELAIECRPSEVSRLIQMLCFGNTFKIGSIHREKIMDYTKQEELAMYHEINGPTIMRDLLRRFDVKGEDTYKKQYLEISEMAKEIKIKTIYNRLIEGNDCANHIFVNDAFFKMLTNGMFVVKPTKHGEEHIIYARSAINLKTLSLNGELLLSVKDKSAITDEMYLTAAKNCYRVLHIFPEHLQTDKILLPLVHSLPGDLRKRVVMYDIKTRQLICKPILSQDKSIKNKDTFRGNKHKIKKNF